MRTLPGYVLLLLSLSAITACQSLGLGKTLSLNNPGFEEGEGSAPTNIPGWLLNQHAGKMGVSAYEIVIDSGAGPGNNRSLRVTRVLDEVYGWVHQKVSVGPDAAGKALHFSALLKAGNVGPEGWLLVVNMNSTAGIIQQFRSQPITGTSDWRRTDLTATIPPGTVKVDVGFLLLDAGTGWADDASLSIE
jgi:hypothetical protein